jgi:hypothetical protein
METVTIPKKEYERLKRIESDREIEESLARSLADAKAGRIKRVA